MDSSEFMVFSIDESIQCIEYFEESLMFISTQKRIILYDLCYSKVIASCEHIPTSTGKIPNHNENQLNQNQANQLTALELHYFPKIYNEQNFKDNYFEQKQNIIKGHLLVHYKLKGMCIYTVNQVNNNQQSDSIKNDEQSSQFELEFNNFTPFMFGSAFLKLVFDDCCLEHAKDQQQNFLYEKVFEQDEAHKMTCDQIDRRLKEIRSFENFELKRREKDCNTFYVYTNENQLYEVKRMKILDGKLQLLQTYQIDEQTAQLSLSTVTYMKVISYSYCRGLKSKKRKERQLVLSMQGGNMYIYQLPYINTDQQDKSIQHYLQPVYTLYLQQFIKPKISLNQDLDYSVLCIQIISDGLGLVVVRRCGTWLADFKNYKIITKLQPKQSINKNNTQNISDNKNTDIYDNKNTDITHNKNNANKAQIEDKNKYYMTNDIRMVRLISCDIVQKNQLTNCPNQKQTNRQQSQQYCPFKKHITISSTIILHTFNKLIKLNLQISITKIFNKNLLYQNSVQVNNIKHSTIEDINTNMIHSLSPHPNSFKNVQQKPNHFSTSNTNKIQLYGNFQQDKIFTLTL